MVYAADEDMTEEERDINHPAFLSRISESFQEAMEMIEEWAEEAGVDLEELKEESEDFLIERDERRADAKEHELVKLASEYSDKANEWFGALEQENPLEPKSDDEQDSINDMHEIIRYYQLFIEVKIYRGLMSRSSEEEFDEGDDSQRDSDGSVKIALIAIDKTLAAWKGLLQERNANIIELIISLLETLRDKCEKEFPNARGFIRPGFDELPDTVV
jgi:hypothetical protein